MIVSVHDTLADLAKRDIFDSRDLVLRLDEVIDDIADLEQDADGNDRQGDLTQAEKDDLHELRQEHDKIEEIISEIEGYAGDKARDGITLIAESYFEDYAEEFADDIGAINRDARWPLTHIDWKAAADDLKQDYTSIDIEGSEYWYR